MRCVKILKKGSFLRLVFFAVCDAFETDYMFCAASVAYFTLVSIIPLIITFFFVEMSLFKINVLSLLPREMLNSPVKPLFERIQKIIQETGLLSGTALPVMLWFARGVFLSVERSFSIILGKHMEASYLKRNLVVITVIFILWVVFFGLYTLKIFVSYLAPGHALLWLLSEISVYVILYAILFCLYRFLLPMRFPLKMVMKTATVVFFVLVGFEKAFAWFVVHISRINILFGSFAAVIIFLMWIYYSVIVILMGVGILKGRMLLESNQASKGNDGAGTGA